MNEHLVKMFTISREEVLGLMNAKIASVVTERAKVVAACEPGPEGRPVLDRERQALQVAIDVLNDVEGQTVFMRDHLGPAVSWDLQWDQLLECRRSLEPVAVNLDQLRLSIEPGREIEKVTHNFNGRRPRW